MAKVSFSKPGSTPETPAPAATQPVINVEAIAVPGDFVAATTTAATPAAPAAPAAPATPTPEMGVPAVIAPTTTAVAPVPPPSFYDDDSLEAGDLVLPRLNIVQKVGDLSNVFPGGTILLNGQLTLVKGPEASKKSDPINLLVVGFQPTVFSEHVEGGLRGNFFRTEADVVKANGTLDWNEAKATGKALYDRVATAMVLIEQVTGLEAGSFPIEILGKRYALALYTMKRTSYTNAAKHFKSARKIGMLREHGYRGGWWTFCSQLKKFETNFAYIPVVAPTVSTTEEFRAALKEIIGF